MGNTRKRIVTKIGDVFCIEIDGQYKCYFQYIANDLRQLNSSVIRVFKEKYPINYIPDIDTIIKGSVSFYAHTILRIGIEDNIWYKIGKSNAIGDTCNLYFRDTNDDFLNPMPKISFNWFVWKIGEEYVKVGQLNDDYKKYELGTVFHYSQIVGRIRTGNYSLPFPD